MTAPARRPRPEHTFWLLKQTLGWPLPKIRTSTAADRWTWLVIAAHTQLRLARPLAADLRRPWERPATPGRLTPARVRRSFWNIRPATLLPARAPNPADPATGDRLKVKLSTQRRPAAASRSATAVTRTAPLVKDIPPDRRWRN